ncbi:hypothetical protein Gogos_000397 [Gossypium gossypioides]|uniref:Uncharacterized protein n=1 Tax=Gossypium gossypioides TaxID=34282 RepID=A0A7J9CSN8_GOSGO|nr:hypothetical protein [Gossypium gossypioides]
MLVWIIAEPGHTICSISDTLRNQSLSIPSILNPSTIISNSITISRISFIPVIHVSSTIHISSTFCIPSTSLTFSVSTSLTLLSPRSRLLSATAVLKHPPKEIFQLVELRGLCVRISLDGVGTINGRGSPPVVTESLWKFPVFVSSYLLLVKLHHTMCFDPHADICNVFDVA